MTNLTQILFSYDFLVVAIGTVLLAIPSAIVGCFSVYKGQSLMADAVGHASYPGVVIAFMLFSVRSSVILTLGAAVVGILAYLTIQMIRKHSVIDFDAALAITLTGFFGLGMVLKSYLQGNSSYMRASQAGLKNYIFGSAAFIMKEDIIMIAICAIIAAVLLALFYKELVASIFDPQFASSIGISMPIVSGVLLLMMVMFIVVGLKCIGAILISSFLTMPCICANQHSRDLKWVLCIAACVAGISAFIGTFLSTAYSGIATGPMVILCMGTFTILSMIFGKYGLIAQRKLGKDAKSCRKYC